MRRILQGAVVIGLLTIMLTMPALAAAGPAYMPPNEAALIQALIKSGRIPRAANPADQEAMLNAYLRQELGSKPEDRVNTGRIASDVAVRGRTSWGRAIALDPGVTTDNALVILVEFDPEDYTSPDFPEVFPGGPLHGDIPAPPPGDNTTFWPGPGDKGFGVTHYQRMLFGTSFPIWDESGKLRGTSTETMQNYYLEMSKGTYRLTGQIKDWVQLPHPEAWYGRDDADGNGHSAVPNWQVALDAVKAFQAADPDFDWTVYDQRNPFGIAGADPDIPDGYVDHLILIHAGVDESAGGGAQGADAIWAHSGWVDSANGRGPGGDGGYRVDTGASDRRPDGVWIGPYVIQPEDGGIGVFCHEFGHDLGLPDEYDTSYTGESPSTFWTLMAGGSWLGKKWGIGTRPAPMNVADKTMLGFITPKSVAVGADAKVRLKPAATGKAGEVAIKVELPSKYSEILLSGTDDLHNPEFWSGSGNSLDQLWTVWDSSADAPLAVQVPASGGALTFDSWYEIEDAYDYGFVQVSSDQGATWTSVAGDHTVDAGLGNPALCGSSGGGVAGSDEPAWETETYPLDAYAGKTMQVRFRYLTDGGLAFRGWEVTNVSLPGTAGTVTFGGADVDFLDPGTPWQPVDGFFGKDYARYYLAEYRDRSGFDGSLANVYSFKSSTSAEFWPANVGLHLLYCDTFYDDNNVGVHPGEGGWMVVDAHPVPDWRTGAMPWGTTKQVRDAAFGTKSSPDLRLTPWINTPETLLLPGRAAQATFDDSKLWWFDWDSDAGVKVDEYGVTVKVTAMDAKGLTVQVHGADEVE